jgi:hypothetical protein
MLNLRIAMLRLLPIITLVFRLLFPSLGVAAQESTPVPQEQIIVLSPVPGQALQGNILITAEINLKDFISAELSFSYAEDHRDTWFLIQEIKEPINEGLNVEWDTTILTDGEYTLRVIVITEQDQYSKIVPDIRVRNYSAIETHTPLPTSTPAPADTLMPTETLTSTNTPVPLTPTPLPSNPVQLNFRDIGLSIGKGVLFAISALVLFGIYVFIRNRRRRG